MVSKFLHTPEWPVSSIVSQTIQLLLLVLRILLLILLLLQLLLLVVIADYKVHSTLLGAREAGVIVEKAWRKTLSKEK